MALRIACQTYTWEMLGDEWTGSVDNLLDWIAAAGYEGIEITCNTIREYADRPVEFVAAAQVRGIIPAAFAYGSPSGFTDLEAFVTDLEAVRRWADFVAYFPATSAGAPVLEFGGAANESREDVFGKLDTALRFYNAAGEIALKAGVRACVHPHSHFGSLLESAEEYRYLVSRLDPQFINFCPDTGHIVRGGQDLLECVKEHLSRVIHVHLKDANAQRVWVGLGEGLCDFPGLMKLLSEAGYDGWIVGEEESAAAREDGIAAINRNREYLHSIGY